MTDTSFNIVDLIENNPITRLSNTYQSNLLTKIKAKFTDQEQQMFVASFYCYLNYNPKEDFVIDLDNVWKWLGFSSKQTAKVLLEKYFLLDKDYIKSLMACHKQSAHTKGGHNKETFLLTIRTFKLFCLKADTKKANTIHDYYINLEDILQEIMHEESNELKLQLEQKTEELQKQTENLHTNTILSEQEKEKIREKTLLEQFPANTQCVYYGFIDNVSEKQERLIKFGNSNNLKNRVYTHKKTYSNFRLVNAFKVENKLQIESAMKNHAFFKERQRTITINSKKFIELLTIDGITLFELDKAIKEIKTTIEYSPENYSKLLEENKELKNKLERSNEVINNEKLYILQTENDCLKLENLKLIKAGGKTPTPPFADDFKCVCKEKGGVGVTPSLITSLRKNVKNKAGTYNIEGKVYTKLEGTRQEVWDEIAYQTSGTLKKSELLINKNGLIVSKRKSMAETHLKRLLHCGVNKTPKLESENR